MIAKASAFADDLDKYAYESDANEFATKLAKVLVAAGKDAPGGGSASRGAQQQRGASADGGAAEPVPVYKPPPGERQSRRLAGTIPEVRPVLHDPKAKAVEYTARRPPKVRPPPVEAEPAEEEAERMEEEGTADASGPASPVGGTAADDQAAADKAASAAAAAAEVTAAEAAVAAAAAAAAMTAAVRALLCPGLKAGLCHAACLIVLAVWVVGGGSGSGRAAPS